MEEKKDQSTSGKNMKVFVDTNILLDYLLKRQPVILTLQILKIQCKMNLPYLQELIT